MRRAAKVDRNHVEIVEGLRAFGARVWSTAGIGDGFPDLVASWNRGTALIEVKDPLQPPSKRRLTPDQQRFHAEWTGGVLAVVTDVEGAIRAVKMAAEMVHE